MSTYQPPYASSSGGGGGRLRQRQSGDFRLHAGANGNGPLPVPAGPQSNRVQHNGHPAGVRAGAGSGFDGPRSPPNNKNTSHVPCKFFRQGTCQAGKACPFSHSLDPAAGVAPCKYFQKGNCKFGAKCALAHILPNGQRVNKPAWSGGHGGRMNAMHSPEHTQQGSLLSMQAHMGPNQPPAYPYAATDEYYGPSGHRPSFEAIPTIDTTFSSHPGSAYGSPSGDGRHPMSPAQKGLSLLDAPLPASFDSQGISHIARYGPIAASVPSRFGLESSPPSSLHNRPGAESSALRNLHSSAFGVDGRSARNGFQSTSPPTSAADELIGRRTMHSERFSRPKMMSSSVGARPPGVGLTDEWDENFAFEEDLVPTALHDLLTPQEKMRRFSRSAADDDSASPSQGLGAHSLHGHRASLSGLGTPLDSSPSAAASKVGSPKVGSPSRFGALFTRHASAAARTSSPADASSAEATSLATQPPAAGSAFGHVGSPLRNSSLHSCAPSLTPNPLASSSSAATIRPSVASRTPSTGAVIDSSFLASPTRAPNMSMLSQQLQRTRLSHRAAEAAEATAPLQHPGVARVASSGSVGAAPPGTGLLGSSPGSGAAAGSGGAAGRLDRAVSSGSIGRERIVEEQEQEGLFDMEEEEGMERRQSKRFSGGWQWGLSGSGRGSPGGLGAIGSRVSSGGTAGSGAGGSGGAGGGA